MSIRRHAAHLRSIPRKRIAVLSVAAFLLCSGLAVGISELPANATGSTLYVNNTATATGGDTSCSDPGFLSAQAAVNAASPGDTVYLCGTMPYAEQIIDTTSITLTGDPGATIMPPAIWAPASAFPPQFTTDNLFVPQAMVVIWGSGVNTTVSGLSITGPLPGNGGCADEEYGIVVFDGANASITGDTVTNIADMNSSLYGCQFGVGILIGRYYWPTSDFKQILTEDFVGTASITNSTITGYQKGGVVVDGTGSSANVNGNTVTGGGATSAFGAIIAQNGIQVSRGATGNVSDNTVSANQYIGSGQASSDGVLVYGGCGDPISTNVAVVQNTLTNNDIGVQFSNADPTCSTPPSTKTQNNAIHNTISDSAITNTSGDGYFQGNNANPLCGYQAGVSDFGNHDLINHNSVSGVGYTPAQNTCNATTPGVVVLPVDVGGSTAARLNKNT